jgi:hypothetical protein
MRAETHKTFEDAIQVAEDAELFLEQAGLKHALNNLTLEDNAATNAAVNYTGANPFQEMNKRFTSSSQEQENRKGGTEEKPKYYSKESRENVRCYNCQKRGHIARFCRNPVRSRSNSRQRGGSRSNRHSASKKVDFDMNHLTDKIKDMVLAVAEGDRRGDRKSDRKHDRSRSRSRSRSHSRTGRSGSRSRSTSPYSWKKKSKSSKNE